MEEHYIDTTCEDDMRSEYDFRGGVRGKHYEAYRKGHTVRILNEDGTISEQHFSPEEDAITLEPDVREYFPDSESVNRTLRSIIAIIPKKRHAKKAS